MIDASFEMYSGDTKTITLPIKNKYGTPVDMTGVTGTLTIAMYKNPTTEQIICQKPIVLTDAVNGYISATLDSKDTFGWFGVFPFDIRVTLTNGSIEVVYEGWVVIKSSPSAILNPKPFIDMNM